MKIAVLTNISNSKSTKEVENNLLDMAKCVSDGLKELGHKVVFINADSNMITNIKKEKIDFVFNVAERFNGQHNFEAHIAAMLEMHKIPFTGASMRAFSTCDDKIRAKELMVHYGLPTPKFQVFRTGKEKLNSNFSFPLIVKPANTHDSIGITEKSVVKDKSALNAQINKLIVELTQPVIVEEYIDGIEIQVGVIGNSSLFTLPPAGVDFSKSKSKILSYEMKWHLDWYKEAPIICPLKLSKSLEKKVSSLAISTHKLLGAVDYSRVDMRLDKNNKPYILEINVNPGLTKDCFMYNTAKVAKISYSDLIKRILDVAKARYRT